MNPEEGGGFRSDYRIIHLIILFVVSGLFSECGEDKNRSQHGTREPQDIL